MNQLYEKKCDCRNYDDPSDHRSTLLKMELPEYEDQQYGGTGYTVFRAMRFMAYVFIVVLLGYSLWRIHVIESTLMANDRFNNISRIINMENSGHRRVSRSAKEGSTFEPNSFTFGEKELRRGTMLTSKNENVPLKKKRPQNKEEFENLVNSLFDKIHIMHNDSDRGHFDHNMREVFQAWFPVFDALLPHELMEDQEILARKERAADKTSEESSEEKKQRVTRAADKTSEESSEEKKQRVARAADKTSEESSEEKKKKQRVVRSVKEPTDRSSQESSEEQPVKESNKITEEHKHSVEKKQDKESKNKQKSSEESSEEKKDQREKREADSSESSSSSDSSEEKKPKWTYYKHKTSAERFQEYDRRFSNYNKQRVVFTRNNEKSNESKSSTSSDSSESSEKPKDKNNLINLVYHVVTQSPNYPNVGLNEIPSDTVKNK